MSCSVAILSGGLATRLRPLTESFPKALIDFHGTPFMEYQFALLRQQGFEHIVLCTGYEGQQIEATFKDGKHLGLQIEYSYDGDPLLGTGGAIKKALPRLSDPFMILYGDSFLQEDYQGILNSFVQETETSSPPPLGLMTVFKNQNQYDASNVHYEEGKIRCYHKRNPTPEMTYIDWGLGLLKKDAFQSFADQQIFDLAEVYETLVTQEQLMGYEVTQRFYEVGSFSGIEEFKQYVLDHNLKSHVTL